MTSRSELSEAWAEGYKSGQDGGSRMSNPFIGKNSENAKNWDQGWIEGSGHDLKQK